ncbi:MAG: dienelactone hydrolase family protein [Acidimicrobiia bacterium]|nr:dienelactone hydrolase family protein [Acidimicrobiia bacterium]NNC75368.1 dienelactone hydrolase family protein [Acidimicrobiia bacterium]
MGEMVQFQSNGREASGYLATPANGSGPGLIVIQEWWGLVPHIKEVADRFAAEGFVALAPDLYDGETVAEPDEAGKLMMALELDKAGKHMGGAIDYLVANDAVTSTGVGVMGFCMGGGLAIWLATTRREVAAAVPFYGAIPWEGVEPDLTATRAAFLGHYAENDDWATMESAREIEATLRSLGHRAEFHLYKDTGHAFFNNTRPEVYDAEASNLAMNRTVEFLHETLT